MTEIVDPLLQARALQEVARNFPTDSYASSTIFWENEHGSAGVSLASEGSCKVFLFEAEQQVETLSEATNLLKAIFAGQLACVTLYANEQHLFCGLMEAADPETGSGQLTFASLRARSMVNFDHAVIATWSRGVHEEEE